MTAPFFIGWERRLPRGLRLPMAATAVAVLGLALVLGAALGRAVDDAGGGDWAGDVTLRGTLTARPYPLLRLPADAAHPGGHTVLMSAFGKSQVAVDFDTMDGHAMQAGGTLVRRGALDMLVVNDPAQLRLPDVAAAAPPATEPLGRWRIVGEICDGKCATGAMRPGTGIAHRACASLCLAGEIPPVLVAVQPVAGGSFLLLAGPDGGPMPAELRRLVGLRLRLDGALERRGDLLVLRADPASVVVQ